MDSTTLFPALLRPEAYPWHPAAVELIETHLSWVFLAGEFVVKLKRPVVYPFVDHRTLTSRYQSCEDEVRLNRRLTEQVYVDVMPIVWTPAGCLVGGQGAPIEWVTVMRWLLASGMFDALAGPGTIPPLIAHGLATRLIPFHLTCAPVCGRSPATTAVATRIFTDNLNELVPYRAAPLGPVQLQLVTEAMQRFTHERGGLLQRHTTAGWIREGHGDLRAEHVCFEPDGTVQIFDCVEFNRDLRCADVASDLIFLPMDLARLGAARRGHPAHPLPRGRDRRAGGPAPLLLGAPGPGAGQDRLPRPHVRPARSQQTVDDRGGELPGSDRRRGADGPASPDRHDRSEWDREVDRGPARGPGPRGSPLRLGRGAKSARGRRGTGPSRWGEGIYSPNMTSATYHHLFALAGDRLAMGEPVVLDATFLAPEQRARAGDLAPRHGAPLVLLETTCDEATVAARFAARLAARTERTEHGQPASDASLATSLQQRAASTKSPPAVPPGALLVPVNTAGPLPISLEGAWASLAREELVLPRVPSSGIGSGAGKPRAASLAGVITPVQVQPGGVSV